MSGLRPLGFLLGKAQMTTGQGAFQDHKVRNPLVVLIPQAADQGGGAAAADDGGNGGVAFRYLSGNAGQVFGKTCAAYYGIHAGAQRRADAVGVLGGGDHGIDGYHSCATGQFLGPPDLRGQGPQVGAFGVSGKIRLPEAANSGGDGAHAAGGGHGTGQTVQADSHAHAALQNRKGESFSPDGYSHSLPTASSTVWLCAYSSSKICLTGLISWSIPAT